MWSRLSILGMLVMAGCTTPTVEQRPIDQTRQRLIALGQAYAQTLAKGKMPSKLADLQPALKSLGDPDELSTSPRDGQPFVILWGTRFTEPEARVYMHEQTGKSGSRFVLLTDGSSFEVSDERFQTMPKVK